MKVSSSKEKILKKIREALSNPVPLPFPKSEGSATVFETQTEDLELLFAEEFTRLTGKFAFCMNERDLQFQLQNLFAQRKWQHIFCAEKNLLKIVEGSTSPTINQTNLAGCDASITSCEYLVARTGSIVISSRQAAGRTASAYASVHICVAYVNQLVFDTRDALKAIKEKYANSFPSFITFTAGPAVTEGIEKTWIVGAQRPKEVYLFLVETGNDLSL